MATVGVAVVALIGGWAIWNFTQNVQYIDCIGPTPLLVVLSDGWPEHDAGVYEQTTIAWAPSILIREEATASVVTRYWGTPPANLGVQYEGGGWLGSIPDDCAPGSDGVVGSIGYGIAAPAEQLASTDDGPDEAGGVAAVPYRRTAPLLQLENGGFTGSLSNRETRALEDTFGHPQVVPVSTGTRVLATVAVWWPIGLIVVGVFLLLFVVMRFKRFRSPADSDV